MTTRESLHKLLDTLPEAALESAERVLQNYKAWIGPPQPPVDVTKMHQQVEEDSGEVRQSMPLARGEGLWVVRSAAAVLNLTVTECPQ